MKFSQRKFPTRLFAIGVLAAAVIAVQAFGQTGSDKTKPSGGIEPGKADVVTAQPVALAIGNMQITQRNIDRYGPFDCTDLHLRGAVPRRPCDQLCQLPMADICLQPDQDKRNDENRRDAGHD